MGETPVRRDCTSKTTNNQCPCSYAWNTTCNLHLLRLVLGSIIGIQVVILTIRIVRVIMRVVSVLTSRRLGKGGQDNNDRPSHDDVGFDDTLSGFWILQVRFAVLKTGRTTEVRPWPSTSNARILHASKVNARTAHFIMQSSVNTRGPTSLPVLWCTYLVQAILPATVTSIRVLDSAKR